MLPGGWDLAACCTPPGAGVLCGYVSHHCCKDAWTWGFLLGVYKVLCNHMGRKVCCEDLPGEISPAFMGSSIRPGQRLDIIWWEEHLLGEEELVQAITDTNNKIKLISHNQEKKSLKKQCKQLWE